MKNNSINSMFLVPKNIYTSMLSRIDEDEARDEIQLINRNIDDGNYIENAINFNNQQDRHKNQIFIKPNSSNDTIRTVANTDANSSVQFGHLNQTLNQSNEVNNTENLQTPVTNLSPNVFASTPKKKVRAISRKSTLPPPSPLFTIEEENIPGNETTESFTCNFCKMRFFEKNALRQHILDDHDKHTTRFEKSSLLNMDLENSQNQNLNLDTPINLDYSDASMSTIPNLSAVENTDGTPITQDANVGPVKTSTPIAGPLKKTRRKKTPYPNPKHIIKNLDFSNDFTSPLANTSDNNLSAETSPNLSAFENTGATPKNQDAGSIRTSSANADQSSDSQKNIKKPYAVEKKRDLVIPRILKRPHSSTTSTSKKQNVNFANGTTLNSSEVASPVPKKRNLRSSSTLIKQRQKNNNQNPTSKVKIRPHLIHFTKNQVTPIKGNLKDITKNAAVFKTTTPKKSKANTTISSTLKKNKNKFKRKAKVHDLDHFSTAGYKKGSIRTFFGRKATRLKLNTPNKKKKKP